MICLERRKKDSQHSIDVNIQDKEGFTSAMLAMKHGDHDCVKMLITVPEVDWNLQNKDGDTAVVIGVICNNLEGLKILRDVPNIDWNRRNNKGESAFTIALKMKNNAIVQFLLSVQSLEVNIYELSEWNLGSQFHSFLSNMMKSSKKKSSCRTQLLLALDFIILFYSFDNMLWSIDLILSILRKTIK